MPYIKLTNMVYTYPGRVLPVLKDVNLSIEKAK